ncbi:MAG TPA: 2-dehydropantoate 2-reductase [Terriglobales bacterium]|nr:2-dehydropantoate 2-reductase [Terriglobales bacterium]
MKHAMLGAGGVGGLIGGLLAAAGDEVVLVLRPETLAGYPAELRLERPTGAVTAPVRGVSTLEEPVDVLWIATKAPQLNDALRRVRTPAERIGAVVPLLNGIDHVALLRERFGKQRVVAATIAVETERTAAGQIVQRSPWVRLNITASGASRLEPARAKLAAAGVEAQFVADETTLLWSKLCFLAPIALATTASGKTVGEVRGDAQWSARLYMAIQEACAVAAAEGAKVDAAKITATAESLPAGMRSSMQKDVGAGRAPELDAIAGPILRGGKKHGVETPSCEQMVRAIQEKSHRG